MCTCTLHRYKSLPNLKFVRQKLLPAGRDTVTHTDAQTTAGDCVSCFSKSAQSRSCWLFTYTCSLGEVLRAEYIEATVKLH